VRFFWREDHVPGWQLEATETVARYVTRARGKPLRNIDLPFSGDEGPCQTPSLRQYLYALEAQQSELPGRHFITPNVWLSIINTYPPRDSEFAD